MEAKICNYFYMLAALLVANIFVVQRSTQKEEKKIAPATTEIRIVLAAPAQRMVFPVLPTVADLSKKRKNKSFSSTGEKKQKNTSDTSTAEASDPAVR
jgi:hypothetical protein